jgi:hypothetical protein
MAQPSDAKDASKAGSATAASSAPVVELPPKAAIADRNPAFKAMG